MRSVFTKDPLAWTIEGPRRSPAFQSSEQRKCYGREEGRKRAADESSSAGNTQVRAPQPCCERAPVCHWRPGDWRSVRLGFMQRSPIVRRLLNRSLTWAVMSERKLRLTVTDFPEANMAKYIPSSPASIPEQDAPAEPPGHDVRALGPSDSSDTGADMLGPGLIDDDMLGLDRGTNEDSEAGHLNAPDAGADIGDLELESNSDRYGTGEHAAAGKEARIRIAGDIAPDRIVSGEEAGLGDGLDEAEEASTPRSESLSS